MSQLEQLQFKTADDLLKMVSDYLAVFNELQSFMNVLKSKLSFFESDRPKIESILSNYNECYEKLRELDIDLQSFSSLDQDEKQMLFLMSAHDLSTAKQFTLELPIKLSDTAHGREMLNSLTAQ